MAISSPLLETTIQGATDVIINISGDISLVEANEAASYVEELAGENANIIFGAMYDESAQDECKITVIATGIQDENATVSVFDAPEKKTVASQAAPRQAVPVREPQAVQSQRQPIPSFLNTQAQSVGYTMQNQAAPSVPTPSVAPQVQQTAMPSMEPAPSVQPSYRPQQNKDLSINIPEFLRNKR